MASFFISDEGPVGRLHPGTRLVALLLACWPPMALEEWRPMAVVLALYLLGALALRAGRNLWRIKTWAAVLFLVTVLLWALFRPVGDDALARVGPVALTGTALRYGAAMGMRLLAFMIAALVFLAASRVEDIQTGFRSLGVPYRAAFAFSLAFRLTPLFLETAEQIAAAQKARGLDLDSGGRLARMRGYVGIIVPVLIAAIRRADGLAVALEAKGFGAAGNRTSLIDYRLGWRDAAWLVAWTGATVFSSAFARGWVSVPGLY